MDNSKTTQRHSADATGIELAAHVLRGGGLVAFPTETVYGLGADARSGAAVAGIYLAKSRPAFNPLIAHVATPAAAMTEGRFNGDAKALAAAFWPGALTLVVPAGPECTISGLARAGLDSVALRVPDHPIANAVLRAAAIPVAAPSANRSGRISPTTADHVAADMAGRIEFVLDGGSTRIGLESTIVACLEGPPRLLRPGGITRADIEHVLGRPLADRDDRATLVSPGQLSSHYAPQSALRLNASDAVPGEGVLDFGGQLGGVQARIRRDLSPQGDVREAAANLFGFLHELDRAGVAVIAVAPIPRNGLGEAINDRLIRAAAPR